MKKGPLFFFFPVICGLIWPKINSRGLQTIISLQSKHLFLICLETKVQLLCQNNINNNNNS